MEQREKRWEVVDEVMSQGLGEVLRGLLEAEGIPALLSQEGAGRAIGLTGGLLGRVQILVPAQHAARAREVLQDYYNGQLDQG